MREADPTQGSRPAAGRDHVPAIRGFRSPRPRMSKNENTPFGCTRRRGARGSDFAERDNKQLQDHGLRRTGCAPSQSRALRQPYVDAHGSEGEGSPQVPTASASQLVAP
jgi:hypothetical protein